MKMNNDFLILSIGKILQIILMLITIKISTSLLSPHDMGNIYMVMTFASFFMLTFLNPVGQYIQRFLNEWNEREILLKNIIYFLIYTFFISCIAIIFMWMYIKFIGLPVSFSSMNFLILLFLYIIFIYVNPQVLSFLNLLYFRLVFIVLSVLTSFGVLLFGSLGVILVEKSAEVWLIGIITSNVIVSIIAYYFFTKKVGLPNFNIKSTYYRYTET